MAAAIVCRPSKPPTIQILARPTQQESARVDRQPRNGEKITRCSRKIDTPKAKALFKYSARRIAKMEAISVAKAKLYK